MRLNALIIGFGSAGKIHYNLLLKNKGIKKVYVFSRRKNFEKNIFHDYNYIKFLKFDLVIIATETFDHLKHIKYFEKNFNNKIILVEKPLYIRTLKIHNPKNKIFVAYNMRFHPIIKNLSRILLSKEIWSVDIVCSSFLPNWRKDILYNKSYSSIKKLGGGALLDLSHELDYGKYLFGRLNVIKSINNKISNLNINVEDYVSIIGKYIKGPYLCMKLDLFSRLVRREIFIEGKNISIKGDFVNNTLSVNNNNKTKKYKWTKNSMENTYRLQLEALIKGQFNLLCSYNDANNIMKLIDNIRYEK